MACEMSKWDSMSSRKGHFSISRTLIKEEPEVVALAMSGMIVMRAECMLHTDAIEYWAMSEHFDEIELGEIVPEYLPEVEKVSLEDGEVRHIIRGWKRQPEPTP